MDRLNAGVRSNGMLFTNYYLAFPLCSPCRSTVLSGRMPHNTGFVDNGSLNSSLFHPVQEAQSLPVWLRKAGYQTMLAGKYMNGYHQHGGSKEQMNFATYVPAGWSDWYGFQTISFFGTRVNINGQTTLYPKDAYQTDIIANTSLAWLKGRGPNGPDGKPTTSGQGQGGYDPEKGPFFMMLTPHAPHAPYTPAPRHKGTLAGLKKPYNPAFNEADDLQCTQPGKMANKSAVDVAKMTEIHQSRSESLLAIDEMIGGLIDLLAIGIGIGKQATLSNTYIFFTSDNGYHLGEHRLNPGKREFFEHDIAVPFIVMGPKVQINATETRIIGNYDLAPTFLELAGATAELPAPPFNTGIDGVSFVPLLFGSADGTAPVLWKRAYSLQESWSTQEGSKGSKKVPVGLIAAYSGLRWKEDREDEEDGSRNVLYVEFTDGNKAFYDLDVDFWQTNNTITTLDPAMEKMYAAELAKVKECTSTACPGH